MNLPNPPIGETKIQSQERRKGEPFPHTLNMSIISEDVCKKFYIQIYKNCKNIKKICLNVLANRLFRYLGREG